MIWLFMITTWLFAAVAICISVVSFYAARTNRSAATAIDTSASVIGDCGRLINQSAQLIASLDSELNEKMIP